MPHRFAIYFAPAAGHPLWVRAAEWLGRDPLTGAVHTAAVAGLDRELLDAHSVSARRYGFHATIKAPMRLAAGVNEADLMTALTQFAAAEAPVSLGPMRLHLIDGFLALVPERQPDALTAFAARVVETFEPHRAPLSAGDRERRVAPGHLSARQVELLDQFGYPYTHEQFQFHMTLTDRLPDAVRPTIVAAAEQHFAADQGAELVLDRLALFTEAEPGAPFLRGPEFLLGPETTP